MATGQSTRSALEISRRHLECSICFERYKEPKILNCLHSFCEECLVKYRDEHFQGAPKILCPVCRQEMVLPETGIPGLKTNFHLKGLVEEFTLQEEVACANNAKCDRCDDGNEATHRCLDCAQNICQTCATARLRIPALLNHRVHALEGIRHGTVGLKEAAEQDASLCPKHTGEVNRFYCQTCERLICQSCTVLDHRRPGHHYVDAADAADICKKSLEKEFPMYTADINDVQTTLADTTHAKQVCGEIVTKTVKMVQDRAARLIAKVKDDEKGLIAQIRQYELNQNKTFSEHEDSVKEMLLRKQHSLMTAKQVTRTASAINFLSLYPIIRTDVESVHMMKSAVIAHKYWHLKFTQNHEVGEIGLGTLTMEGNRWGKCREQITPSGGRMAYFQRIACRPDQIAVVECNVLSLFLNNNRVMIYNYQGGLEGKIHLVGRSVDIAAAPNHWVVVNDRSLKSYDRDSNLTATFEMLHARNQSGPRSVAVRKDGTIIVGDVKTMVLTEHSPTDGSLIRTVPVKTPPRYLAVCSDNSVAVSGGAQVDVHGCESLNVIVFSILPTIGGRPVKNCEGVCCDSSSIFVVVDNDERDAGHIHRYNNKGRFVSCVTQFLRWPFGVACTQDGKLVVADEETIKVYEKE